jgi:hypothetical protein
MPLTGRYLFIAAMDVEPDRDALFNEVYDKEHVPSLIKVPGLISVARFKREPLRMSIGGEIKTIDLVDEPRYTALYEVEGPDVMSTPAWGKAVEEGRWPAQVRPYTRNRKHTLYRKIG